MDSTVLIVGSGAVHNAWAPVLRAMEKAYERAIPSDRNLPFVCTTWSLRWMNSRLKNPMLSPGLQRKLANAYRLECEEYQRLKEAICTELGRAQNSGELAATPALLELRARLNPKDSLIITTNWDHTVDMIFTGFKVQHLHGTFTNAGSLYLPSESVEEPYRQDTDPRSLHPAQAGQAINALESASRLILCGIRLSSFDVELGYLISGGFSGTANPQRVEIIDTDPEAVSENLRFHMLSLRPEAISLKRVSVAA